MLKSSGIGSFAPALQGRLWAVLFLGAGLFLLVFGPMMWYYDLPPERLIEKQFAENFRDK